MNNQTAISSVYFNRKDRPKEFIEEAVKKVADFFKDREDYLDNFCLMISSSKNWYIEEKELDKELLSKWKEKFIGDHTYSKSKSDLADVVEEAFLKCETFDDFCSLRGLLFEGVLIGVFGGSQIINNNDPSFGWGAEVKVIMKGHIETVDYQCQLKRNSDCNSRLTIDFAYWNPQNKHGEFFECKVTPKNFSCKEDNYIKVLQDTITAIEGSGNYYVASPHKERAFKFSTMFSNSVKPFGIESIKGMYA
ncbi:hypothetical protein CD30_19605 [Ureibacillus massiliensis 4400831 = CIP 108448 = CCUG 49529]|uniref:Uncharacterized protein n=1 Tax=Ureibacillus massiliensis 4400831 = CIP 108448 = CCUG 49529 TaxID=1211035 RepID=A0A0A3J0P7_9BACL|nr:hypothetical protein [Ureibacillus massiliensis]KGR80632.1 hypothetical protein CD30_19605 [Ureibacillus massiliensis 4400831 = CIP 108448 = CCUG 49529]